jgi:hypothetical protein
MFNKKEYIEFAQVEVNRILEHMNPSIDVSTILENIGGEYHSVSFEALPGLAPMIEVISEFALVEESPINKTTSSYIISISKF